MINHTTPPRDRMVKLYDAAGIPLHDKDGGPMLGFWHADAECFVTADTCLAITAEPVMWSEVA